MPPIAIKSTARINRKLGRAVITQPDNKIFIINLDRSDTIGRGEDVPVEFFLKSEEEQIESRDAGLYPFSDLMDYVRLAHSQEACLQMVHMAFDREKDVRRREAAATFALNSMRNKSIKSWLVAWLKDNPPEKAEVGRLPNDELRRFVISCIRASARRRRRQPQPQLLSVS